MTNIDLDTLNSLLDAKIRNFEDEREHAANNGWFDKAAKIDNILEGIRKAKYVANSGDCHASVLKI